MIERRKIKLGWLLVLCVCVGGEVIRGATDSPQEILEALDGSSEVAKREVLRLVFDKPYKYRNKAIKDEIKTVWKTGKSDILRYEALLAFGSLVGPSSLNIISSELSEEDCLSRAFVAYGVFELNESKQSFKLMIQRVLDVNVQEFRERVWDAGSRYLRREYGFSHIEEWPGIFNVNELLELLDVELSNPKLFWEENTIRRNLREISRVGERYLMEQSHEQIVRRVSVKDLLDSNYLDALPDSVSGEDYLGLSMAFDSPRLIVKTSDGRRIVYRR